MGDRPIQLYGVDTWTFRQLDRCYGLTKGSSFRAFKRVRSELEEGRDYFWLEAGANADLIERLRSGSDIYVSTINLVLLARPACERMALAGGAGGRR